MIPYFVASKLHVETTPVHGSRSILPDKVELLQLIQKHFWLGPWCWAKDSFFGSKVDRLTLTGSTLI